MLGSQLYESRDISPASGRDKPGGAGKVTFQKPAVYADEKPNNSVVPAHLSNNGFFSADNGGKGVSQGELRTAFRPFPDAEPNKRFLRVACCTSSSSARSSGKVHELAEPRGRGGRVISTISSETRPVGWMGYRGESTSKVCSQGC
jgi:hypothetical protein